jgi:hypothetical protein
MNQIQTDPDPWNDKVTAMAELARPVWEQSQDHEIFRRFLNDQGWIPLLAIAVIRQVMDCSLRDAMRTYAAYERSTSAESATTT